MDLWDQRGLPDFAARAVAVPRLRAGRTLGLARCGLRHDRRCGDTSWNGIGALEHACFAAAPWRALRNGRQITIGAVPVRHAFKPRRHKGTKNKCLPFVSWCPRWEAIKSFSKDTCDFAVRRGSRHRSELADAVARPRRASSRPHGSHIAAHGDGDEPAPINPYR